jgi:hypothetical protein
MAATKPVIHPRFHHVNLKTTRLDELNALPCSRFPISPTFECDVFGDWSKSKRWMQSSLEFSQDPLGKFVDPGKVAEDRADGAGFEKIHEKAMAGGYAPETAPIELPEAS